MLESSNVTCSLQCFHSKVTFDKDVLGYPITYTVNPRTNCVDYIEVRFYIELYDLMKTLKMHFKMAKHVFILLDMCIR